MERHRQRSRRQQEDGLDGHDEDGALSAFVCPITMQVMRDPVVIDTGHAFEREAIARWFAECRDLGRGPCCPITMREVRSADLRPVLALRDAIEEWADRQQRDELRRACRWLTKDATEKEAVRALGCVARGWSRGGQASRRTVRAEGIIPMVGGMLRSGSAMVRLKALEAIQEFARETDQDREAVSQGDTIRTIIKFIDCEDCQERELAVSALCDLSKSELVCGKVSELNGAVLILCKVCGSKADNPTIAEKAEKTLENLDRCEKNAVQMAENGRLEPLLNLLIEGSPETQLLMASSLEKIVLSNDLKILVARRVGSLFGGIVEKGSLEAKEVAFKVLEHVSANADSAKVLIEENVLLPLFRVLSINRTSLLPPRLQEAAAAVLANLVASGVDFGTVPLDGDRTLVSEDIVHSLLLLISNTSPPIQCKLLEFFGTLSSSTGTVLSIVSAIKSSGAITNLVQFVESDHQESRTASIKLIHKISFHMEYEIAQVFRASPTLLGCLVKVAFVNDGNAAADEQDAALQILANLPKRDKHLTRELMEQGAFKVAASKVLSIYRRDAGTGSDIYDNAVLEGLAKVLARITYALRDEPRCVSLAREYNLAALFASLLRLNGLDEVQVVSAKALMNLSLESKYLTSTPKFDAEQRSKLALFGRKPTNIQLCRVHSGVCSIRDNFCILEGRAVERLIHCLNHSNKKVVEAALAAICTLLEDGVEAAEGVLVLHRSNGVAPIFDILKENPTGSLQHRVTWAVERILRAEDIAQAASTDRSLGSALVHAFQHGDSRTRRIAEAALKHVQKLPVFSLIIDKRPSIRGSSMGSMERFIKFDR
ncbi:U-box domain-containing protein 24 [Zea mays]|uniref:RING-type E3 ubiquitin transferase n=2 Tax=Zea mays TaxID=4577 RepID=A0A1D6IAU7_MAIZE|nr:U-box domain-containing protein 24 [Zea mays]ONM57094.1 U-box domain-containing protein 44 [Zea mays]|eukprot:XP_020396773.2 U-box domain-containing protein 44 [Zea mays]